MQLLDRRVGLVNIAPIVYVRTAWWECHLDHSNGGPDLDDFWRTPWRNSPSEVWKCEMALSENAASFWSIGQSSLSMLFHVETAIFLRWNPPFLSIFQTHPVMLPWLACPLHRRWCPWWPQPWIHGGTHGDRLPRRIRLSWPLTTFSIPRNHPSIGGGKWWKGGTDEKKSRAVWKVLLMVGESSNVPVSWCWGVACLITWGNINTVQFGSVLNVRCLKKNRQGAGGTT